MEKPSPTKCLWMSLLTFGATLSFAFHAWQQKQQGDSVFLLLLAGAMICFGRVCYWASSYAEHKAAEAAEPVEKKPPEWKYSPWRTVYVCQKCEGILNTEDHVRLSLKCCPHCAAWSAGGRAPSKMRRGRERWREENHLVVGQSEWEWYDEPPPAIKPDRVGNAAERSPS